MKNRTSMTTNAAPPNFSPAAPNLSASPASAARSRRTSLEATLARFPRGLVKSAQPGALSLSQATEAGTVYRVDEIAALTEIARKNGLAVHMDGARFANAVVGLGVSPADMTWRAGVDALSFGATKNGALACEAVIFFDPDRAASFPFLRKRGGHTLSKGRFLGAQMLAYLEGGLWLDLAARANAAAQSLRRCARSAPRRAPRLADRRQRGFRRRPDRTRRALEARRRGVLRLADAGAGERACAWRRRSPLSLRNFVRNYRRRNRRAGETRGELMIFAPYPCRNRRQGLQSAL